MKEPGNGNNKTRRDFLKNSAALASVTAIGPLTGLSSFAGEQKSDSKKMNGIQIGAVSFVDEGVNEVLDVVQMRGAVNTLFLTTFTYGRGLSGRQIPGRKFPDHGSRESDEKTFHGGNYAMPHPEYYTNKLLDVRETRAPEHGEFDLLASIIPEARKRGLKVFASVEDQWRSDVPGVSELVEMDIQGRKARTLCLFKPEVRAFWRGLVTDLCMSYDIDGILFFNERNGPLLTALGASHFQVIDSSRVTCFCEDHLRTARVYGIDPVRAKEGYQKLDLFVQNSLKGKRPSDGYYVEFQRLLLEYPEIIAYDKLFDFAKHQVLKEVYSTVKKINENLQVGFHVEHVNSFNPFFRASRSYEELAGMADFLKVVTYNNAGGERYARFINNIHSTVFRDVPPEELMRFNNHLLNYSEEEASLDQLPMAGLSVDYVYRETRRALTGVSGKCFILPGIDVNLPTGNESRKASPEDTYAATLAAFRAGSDGVILSRKYSEMFLANLAAAGRAIRDGTK